jgi:hypothetical protein
MPSASRLVAEIFHTRLSNRAARARAEKPKPKHKR